jgi:hypothetical protein
MWKQQMAATREEWRPIIEQLYDEEEEENM